MTFFFWKYSLIFFFSSKISKYSFLIDSNLIAFRSSIYAALKIKSLTFFISSYAICS